MKEREGFNENSLDYKLSSIAKNPYKDLSFEELFSPNHTNSVNWSIFGSHLLCFKLMD